MMSKIPKSFKLFATTINVVYDNKLMNENQQYGQANYSQNTIILSDNDGLDPISIDTQLDTFYHEKVHVILDTMGYHDLSENEQFVDLFGKLLRQADETAVYKK